MKRHSNSAQSPIPVALVYWGRLGAGAVLLDRTARALDADPRFAVYASASKQSELPPALPGDRLLPIDTFTGPVSVAVRTAVSPLAIGRLVGRMKASGIRAIVTIMPHAWGLALQRAARRSGIATMIIVHDADPHPGERRPALDWLSRCEARDSDSVVTLSRHVAGRLSERGGAPGSTTLFHPVIGFCAKAPAQRPRTPFRLVFFGRILPYKGLPLLLEAFYWLRAHAVPCELTIVGRGEIDADPLLLTQPGVTLKTGWVAPDAIGDVFASADAIILPYIEASQSGVAPAAYGAGVPVVATPVGGLIEQVIDGRTGLLAQSVDAAALGRAIRRLVESPELYAHCLAGVAEYAAAHRPETFATVLGDAIIEMLGRTG